MHDASFGSSPLFASVRARWAEHKPKLETEVKPN